MLTIVAAGGSGTRMAPSTRFINKHLISVGFGELMIDMPLNFLSKYDIHELTIVTGSNHASQICEYVGDGEKYGFTRVEYAFQPKPLGIADVFNRVSHKNTQQGVFIILGDNYFSEKQTFNIVPGHACVFEYDLGHPARAKAFGQVIRNENGKPISVVEKPKHPTHGKILTGLYYFPDSVFNIVKCLEPSQRGELEITDLIRTYLQRDKIFVNEVVGDWQDLGEHDSWASFVSKRFNGLESPPEEEEWHG